MKKGNINDILILKHDRGKDDNHERQRKSRRNFAQAFKK